MDNGEVHHKTATIPGDEGAEIPQETAGFNGSYQSINQLLDITVEQNEKIREEQQNIKKILEVRLSL